MGRRKKSGGVDPRNRKTVLATIDLDTEDGKLIDDVYKGIKSNKAGLSNWKQFVTKALALYTQLLNRNFEGLSKFLPKIAPAFDLYESIEIGDFSVFRELFPERYRVLCLEIQAEVLSGINQEGQQDVLKELRNIKSEIVNLKASGLISSPTSGGGIKQLGTLAIPNPSFEDDDEDLFGVNKDKTAGERAANNFLASLKRL